MAERLVIFVCASLLTLLAVALVMDYQKFSKQLHACEQAGGVFVERHCWSKDVFVTPKEIE